MEASQSEQDEGGEQGKVAALAGLSTLSPRGNDDDDDDNEQAHGLPKKIGGCFAKGWGVRCGRRCGAWSAALCAKRQ